MNSVNSDLYERDLYAWSGEQAAKLRASQVAGLDWEHLAEELEEWMGNTRRELHRRLRILVGHLLKWRYQPAQRCSSWRGSIRTQRDELDTLFEDNPSLRRLLPERLRKAYGPAVQLAANDTGLPVGTFPAECPFTTEQVLNEDFWPE
jgi:hypothetical protein